MKKLLAVTLVATMMTAAGLAQTKAAAFQAKPNLKATPAAVSGAAAGYVPLFTNASGDMTKSALFQLAGTNTTYLGFGTATPSFNLHFVSTVDPAAITVDGYGAVGINFIGRRAQGTLTNPTALLANDNIMTMQGRGYGTTGFSELSRAYMKFFAAENWTDLAQGTYLSLATTAKGSNATAERLRILDSGNVGIGTIAPAFPLSVNGAIQSLSGGFKFPDGTTQTTAAVGGGGGSVTVTSPDSSITVGGTASAPTVIVNTANIQKRVTGTCPAGSAATGVTQAGGVTCGTIGGSGTLVSVPVIVAQTSFTGVYGLGTTNAIYTAPADGFYRVSVYMNVVAQGGCSSAPCSGEQITVTWNDGVSTTALTTANCNLVTSCGSSAVVPVWVKSGQAISAYGQAYGSGTAPTGGSYNAYVLVEQLKL